MNRHPARVDRHRQMVGHNNPARVDRHRQMVGHNNLVRVGHNNLVRVDHNNLVVPLMPLHHYSVG